MTLKQYNVLKRKRKQENNDVQVVPAKKISDELVTTKPKWINRHRVLIFATRGINHRHRHLMEDLKTLMPHHRPECKMERTKTLQVVNEMCEMKNCNKAILFEGRLKRDLYMWIANVSAGPSVKFLVENIYTMGELKLTGNCLKGSRPLLSFDESFIKHTHYSLLKELLTQIFGVPYHHPKSQPFYDHVYIFSILDHRIWFRNFQILTEDGALAEIGPRFVLNPVKIFAKSFNGDILWDNPNYVSPAKYRQSLTKKAAGKYINRIEQKMAREASKPEQSYALNPTDEIFKGELLKKALEVQEKFEALNGNEEITSDKVKRVKKPVTEKKKAVVKKKPVVKKKTIKKSTSKSRLET
ncbi:PREDICTED: ribosome biogenesis protein BRX1 homolog [Dinoponera quadriceps]|uniref:Ribosome biogenesis protein BRX1 homolog n=1 Tax=Dinoponera quadriceps TaxID=609295 RepID=A0A6P3Y9I6_DINQU|nr:PREDICTED: ribosome biogenesis protein BRX1 homolog [Dinoponera quadriceps]